MRSLAATTVLLLVLPAAAALAGDAPPAAPAERPLSPMMAEIEDALAATRETVAELGDLYRATTDQAAALSLLERIREAKRAGHVEIYEIQLRYARQEGRRETAAELEQVIAGLTSPPRRGEPRPRPAER
jgi:hypothetical protein